MKKFAALFMALMMLFSMTAMAAVDSPDSGAADSPDSGAADSPSAGTTVVTPAASAAEVKIGQVLWAAHGTKCFAVMTVAVQDDVIVAAYIDEFQFMDTTAVGVPNSDSDFGTSFPEGKVLASKRVNAAMYSDNMAKVGSTVSLDDNYAAIEAYVVGLTVADLEAVLVDMTTESAVDAVSGATLQDTLGYLQGLLAAAKAAQ